MSVPSITSSQREAAAGPLDGRWQERLVFVMDMMRQMSRESDPQNMVRNYGMRMRKLFPGDASVSLSRRGLSRPRVRITRSHLWSPDVNPWTAKKHVVLDGGLLGDLIWDEEARVIEDVQVSADDPAEPHLRGMRSLAALPMFDAGDSLNMVIALSTQPGVFNPEQLPERVWITNLFGRATQNLVLSAELKAAYEAVDRELKIVADMQRALLPRRLPKIPNMELAAHYQTSRRAGGDYYDFFELPDGCWGMFIADVSGHGTPAAVMMAITHSIAHTHVGPHTPPSVLMKFLNEHLTARYTVDTGSFVTAFYGIYDPKTRKILYSCAGHCPPRLKRGSDGSVVVLNQAPALPLGIEADETYTDKIETLHPDDVLVLYTDGVTESRKAGSSELFGEARVDAVLEKCGCDPETIIRNTMLAVEDFTDSAAPLDDITMVVAKAT